MLKVSVSIYIYIYISFACFINLQNDFVYVAATALDPAIMFSIVIHSSIQTYKCIYTIYSSVDVRGEGATPREHPVAVVSLKLCLCHRRAWSGPAMACFPVQRDFAMMMFQRHAWLRGRSVQRSCVDSRPSFRFELAGVGNKRSSREVFLGLAWEEVRWVAFFFELGLWFQCCFVCAGLWFWAALDSEVDRWVGFLGFRGLGPLWSLSCV